MRREQVEGETLSLPHSRPMPNIGRRVHELRVIDQRNTWRIVYRVDPDSIVIAEVFAKRTKQTPERIVRVCKERFTRYDQIVGGI